MGKKLFAAVLAVTLMFGGVMTGCADKIEGPVYTSEEKYDIGTWVGISDKIVEYDEDGEKTGNVRYLTEEEFLAKYKDIADSGITIAFPGYDVMINGRESYNLKALKAAHQVGIKHILGDSTLRDYLFQCNTLIKSGTPRSECVQHTKELLKMYTDSEYYSALYGFMMKDEPGETMFDQLATAQSVFKEAAPDLMFYGNLFPVVAMGYQLSGTSESVTYDDYLTKWFAKVKDNYVSYDHYPLYGNGAGETSIESSFLYNMDLMQSKIKQEGNGRKLWTFIQSISFGGKNRGLTCKADANFQAMSFLAYGGDCIQWFCYAPPPVSDGATVFGNDALVDRDYEKTEVFNYVKSVNQDIQALMPYYKNFTWQGVMLSKVYDDTGNLEYLEDSDNLITQDKTLTAFSSTEDAFTGVFQDKDGKPAYMAVNFTDPGKKLGNTLTMTFKDSDKVVILRNGARSVQKLKKGVLTLKLETGEGAFIIPFAD